MTVRPKKRKVRGPREIISRSGLVSEWELSVHAWTEGAAVDDRRRTDSLHLSLRGAFTEAVSGVAQFDFLIYPEERPEAGRAEIPSVGTFLRAKPVLEAAVGLSESHFQAILSVAIAGKLGALQVTFQKLRYGSGLISSVLFSTSKRIEESTRNVAKG